MTEEKLRCVDPDRSGRTIALWLRGTSEICLLALAVSASGGCPTQAQSYPTSASGPAAASSAAPIEALHPVLDHIGETLAGLNVGRWKAPGEIRNVTQRDIDSIQRDLQSTLPPLLNEASALPPSVAPTFAVYRNIDALYDVLLRVSETATLAGSQADSANLQSALSSLEEARRNLGETILRLAGSQQQELLALRAAAAAAAAAAKAVPPPTKIVVDDGPAPATRSPSSKRKKKPASTAAPAAPAASPQ